MFARCPVASLSLPDRGEWLQQGRDCVARKAENVICPFTEKVGHPYLNAGGLHSCMKRMPSSQGLLTNHQGFPEAFASQLYRGLGGTVCSGEGLSLPAAQSQCALLIEGQTVLRVCDREPGLRGEPHGAHLPVECWGNSRSPGRVPALSAGTGSRRALAVCVVDILDISELVLPSHFSKSGKGIRGGCLVPEDAVNGLILCGAGSRDRGLPARAAGRQ